MKQSQDLTLRRASRLSQFREYAIQAALIGCSLVAIFTTIGIVASLAFEAIRFFGKIPVQSFLFGLEWSPQTAIRDDQVGASGAFGAVLGNLAQKTVQMLSCGGRASLAQLTSRKYNLSGSLHSPESIPISTVSRPSTIPRTCWGPN